MMKAIITAGGRGTRLRPLTLSGPKEMITIFGKPVIEYNIDLVRRAGIRQASIIVCENKDAIMNYVRDGSLWDLEVDYIFQKFQGGLGHAIFLGLEHLKGMKDETVPILLGDDAVFGSNALGDIIKAHQEKNATATICVELTDTPERFGILKFKNIENRCGRIIEAYEKPKEKELLERLKLDHEMVKKLGLFQKNENCLWPAISAMYVMERDYILKYKNLVPFVKGEQQITPAFQMAINDGEIVIGNFLKGQRIDIGNWNFLKNIRELYLKITDTELENMIKERNEMMEKVNKMINNSE